MRNSFQVRSNSRYLENCINYCDFYNIAFYFCKVETHENLQGTHVTHYTIIKESKTNNMINNYLSYYTSDDCFGYWTTFIDLDVYVWCGRAPSSCFLSLYFILACFLVANIGVLVHECRFLGTHFAIFIP